MKKIVILSILLLACLSCSAKKQQFTSEEDRIKSLIAKYKIHFEKSYNYAYKDGKIDKTTEFLTLIKEFDKNGNIIRLEKHNRPVHGWEAYDYSIVYEYDDAGRLVKSVNKDYQGADTDYTIFEYNKKGERTLSRIQAPDGTATYSETYSYNDNGVKSETSAFVHQEGNKILYRKELYDAAGAPKETSYFDGKGNVAAKDIYSADSAVEKIKKSYNAKNELTETLTDQYNKKGIKLSSTQFYTEFTEFEMSRNTKMVWKFSYDRYSLLKETTAFTNDGKASYTEKILREKY